MLQPDSKLTSGGVYVQKPRSNVYTVMLVLALLAILVGCIFLILEVQDYNWDIKATRAQRVAPVNTLHGTLPGTMHLT